MCDGDHSLSSGVMSRDAYAPLPPPRPPALSRRELLRLRPSRLWRADVDYDGATARVREEWERNDREPLMRALEPVAQTLVELAGVRAGDRVLDAAAGDGNVALAATRRGSQVEACDLAAAMVERGARRCGGIRFVRADVQALPYPDASFDVVLSSFGFALAPRPLQAARELVRVCRPGGTVALAAWVPRGLPGALDEFVDLPPGIPSPALWGREPRMRKRLEPLLDDVVVRTRTVSLEFPSPDALLAQLVRPELAESLRPAFLRLLAATNNRPPSAVVGARHLLVRGTVRIA